MKVAIVHDYIKEYGGAERVLEALHEAYPKAPIFTTVYLPKFLGPHRERFKNWDIRTSWLQCIPFKGKLISIFRIIAPFVFASWNFSDYDVVIVSATGAYSPNLIKTKNNNSTLYPKPYTLHLCYCHTPPRYLYGYPTAREWGKIGVIRVIGEIANHCLRMIDYSSSQNVDFFIANSKNVASRIKKFYRRDAVVIYPPVTLGERRKGKGETKPYTLYPSPYFLAGGRLARPKRIDLAVSACTKLALPLKVFGKEFAGYGQELRIMAGPTIQFLGEVSEEDKWELMKNARAFIFPSIEEDFGITPVEAMMVGTPVIALRSGGIVESVVESKTGLFFDQPTIESLVNSLIHFDKLRFDREAIIKHAQKFSKERFKREIKEFIESSMHVVA